ncbi:MAG TPA: DUF885 domain-containing protein [Candidatus Xenobia bacterium]|jgi:uncharacterized protein (DUF885 family)
MRTLWLLALLVCLSLPVQAESWRHAVDAYFDNHFGYHPTDGTQAGFHQYDSRLEDVSAASRAAEAADLHSFLKRFEALPPASLSPSDRIDRDLLIHTIRGQLLELERIRSWRKNPDQYTSACTVSAFSLISRTFRTPPDRLEALIEREKAMPGVLQEARANLAHCPPEFVEIALDQLPDSISFFQHDVPEAFKTLQGDPLMAEFQASNEAVINALQAYQDWLKAVVAPHADGDFRLGADNLARMLADDEMVDVPLDRILAVGMTNMRANQAQFRRVAHGIDPNRPASALLADLQHDHPAPDHLLDTFRHTLGGIRSFIVRHHIVGIPSKVMPILEETPPFDRALTFASMDIPGPFEREATEAYFNVTLPDPGLTPEQVEDYMGGFNRGTIVSTAVHEAFPGHYVQYLWLQRLHDKARQLITAYSTSEGWAHYCEQMMLDQGLFKNDPKLRLGQLQDALLRNARLVVSLQMHRGRMTRDQAVQFFVHEGYQTPTDARREVLRGTADPLYLCYTLGKLQIMKLRADYLQAHPGATIGQFHDAFMRQGILPVCLIRRALLGSDGPLL